VDEPLFAALARASEGRMCNFNSQGLANMAWAFASVGKAGEPFFAALARASEGRMCNFNPQDLANMAWAFAVFDYYSGSLFGTSFADCCEATFSDVRATLPDLSLAPVASVGSVASRAYVSPAAFGCIAGSMQCRFQFNQTLSIEVAAPCDCCPERARCVLSGRGEGNRIWV